MTVPQRFDGAASATQDLLSVLNSHMLSYDAASSSPLSGRLPGVDVLSCSDNKTQAASTTTPTGPPCTTTRKKLHTALNIS